MLRAQTADLVGEHVEAGGRAGFERVFALDHRLVNLGTPFDVVAFHGQQLLKDVGGRRSASPPTLPFPQNAVRRSGLLPPKRLLGDERVRDPSTGRAPCRRPGGGA